MEMDEKLDHVSAQLDILIAQNIAITEQQEMLERTLYFNARKDSEIGEQYVKLCQLVVAMYAMVDNRLHKREIVLCTHNDLNS